MVWGHLDINVGWEVIGKQIEVAAGSDGLQERLKEVRPSKGARAHQVDDMQEAGVRLQYTSASEIEG